MLPQIRKEWGSCERNRAEIFQILIWARSLCEGHIRCAKGTFATQSAVCLIPLNQGNLHGDKTRKRSNLKPSPWGRWISRPRSGYIFGENRERRMRWILKIIALCTHLIYITTKNKTAFRNRNAVLFTQVIKLKRGLPYRNEGNESKRVQSWECRLQQP